MGLRAAALPLLVLGLDMPAAAQEGAAAPPVSLGAEVTTTSRYVSRGLDDGRGVSIQPNVWVSRGNWRVASWFNFTGAPSGGAASFTEQDIVTQYGVTVGTFQLSGGWTAYVYPGAVDGRFSHEAFAVVGLDTPGAPSLAVYRDLRLGSGTYVSLSAGHAWEGRAAGGDLTISTSVAFNDRQWTEHSGWSDAQLSIKWTVRAHGERVHVSPFVTRSQSLDRRITRSRSFGGLELAVR